MPARSAGSSSGRTALLALTALALLALVRPAWAGTPPAPARGGEAIAARAPAQTPAANDGRAAFGRPCASDAGAVEGAGTERPGALATSVSASEVCGASATSPDQLARELHVRPRRRGPLPRGHLVPAIESAVITGVMLGWNASIGAAPWARVNQDTIGRNLRSSWVIDDDAFWINQVGHPYQGIFPYGAARSAGLGFWSSTPYPVVASAVWEVVGETTLPSVNDQVTTSVAGVVLGEALHRISGMILDGSQSPGRIAAASVIAPMESINRALIGTEPEGPTPPSRVLVRAGAVAFDPNRRTDGREGIVPELGVRLSYGLPWDPRFAFERPFDHFELESTYSTEKNPMATLLARGVVAGRTFERESVRGLAGIALGFDFSALRRYSVSTSTVGLSAEGRWEVSPRLALEGSATASAVLLGAAGYLGGRAEDLRSYRMGPGGQGHLELQLLALDRIAARVAARQYLVAGLGSIHGLERVSNLSASLQVRIRGPHALGVEGVLAHHSGDAGAGAPARSESGTQLRAYYAFTTGPR